MAFNHAKIIAQLDEALARDDPAEPWSALAQALAELRPMDPAGAWAVVDRDQKLRAILAGGPEEGIAGLLLNRLESLARTAACLSCGTCCRTSSPTLYASDLELVRSGALPREQLYCLRAGERVRSARLGGDHPLTHELVKLRERPGQGCVFLSENRCGLYESRPRQCRWLECWSGRHAGQLESEPRLERRELFAGDETALALMAEYEVKTPAAGLDEACQGAARGETRAREELSRLILLDKRLRYAVQDRYGYPEAELELMWGRGAWRIARAYGISVSPAIPA